MRNGLSVMDAMAEVERFNIHEMEDQFGRAMSGNDPVNFDFQDKQAGNFSLKIEVLNSVLIYKKNIKSQQSAFQIPLYRDESTLVIMFQESGHSVFRNKNDCFEISPGSHSMHFFPGFDSDFCVHENQDIDNLTIKIKMDYFEKFVLDNRQTGGWLYDEMQKNNVISTNKGLPISPEIKTILHQIKNCPYDDLLKELYTDGLIKMLLTQQLNLYNQLVKNKPAWHDDKISRQDVEKLHGIKSNLDQHYLDELSLEDLTRQFILNEFKLKYGFKKLFGTSVMNYIYEKRMNHAKKLLLHTDKSIDEIAFTLGFSYSNNFSASFKKRFDYSPTEFRKGV